MLSRGPLESLVETLNPLGNQHIVLEAYIGFASFNSGFICQRGDTFGRCCIQANAEARHWLTNIALSRSGGFGLEHLWPLKVSKIQLLRNWLATNGLKLARRGPMQLETFSVSYTGKTKRCL